MTLLSNISDQQVIEHPFPHLVIRDALDDELCQQLIQQFPPIDTITQGRNYGNNWRFSYSCRSVRANSQIAQCWHDLVEEHVSQRFLGDVMRVFGGNIRSLYPWLEDCYGQLDQLAAGVRNVDTFSDADILLDAQICVNTPIRRRTSTVRGPHVDLPNKLFAGLFYLRSDQDDSSGGALELYASRDGQPMKFEHQFTGRQNLEVVSTVEYERNVAVFLINSIHSLHGVTARSVTPHPRLFLNLVGELSRPLFDIPQAGTVEKMVNRFNRLWQWLR